MKEYYVIKCDLTCDYLVRNATGYVGINNNTDEIHASCLIAGAMNFEDSKKAEAFWDKHKDEIVWNTRRNIHNPRICKVEESDVWNLD